MVRSSHSQPEIDVRNPNLFQKVSNLHPCLHAKKLDKFLGYKIPKIEIKLQQKYRFYDRLNDESSRKQHYQGTQTWIGLHPQALQTPYSDIYDALELLKGFDIHKIVDIGAGYGRVGIVMNSVFPKAKFIGFEILKQRESEGNRIFDSFNLGNCEIRLKNVLDEDFELPHAEVYFIYDFSESEDICKILDVLAARLGKENFFLITKGDRMNSLLAKKYKQFGIGNGPMSSGKLKIYSSISSIANFQNRSKDGNR